MEYEFTVFCVTVIALLALAQGDKMTARKTLDIISNLSQSLVQALRQLQEKMIP